MLAKFTIDGQRYFKVVAIRYVVWRDKDRTNGPESVIALCHRELPDWGSELFVSVADIVAYRQSSDVIPRRSSWNPNTATADG